MKVGRQLTTDLLESLIAAMGTLDGVTLALLRGEVPSTPGAPLSSFTLANFSGYAPATIEAADWIGPAVTSLGVNAIITDDKSFTADDPLETVNTITGWLIHDGTNPLFWDSLPEPIYVDTPGQILLARGGGGFGVTVESIGDVRRV